MRTSIYIDGFNLYYGAVKGTPYKWLDFKAVFAMLLQPHHQITAINYFTAQVSGKRDPQQPIRQQTYWRALQASTPEFRLVKGSFLTHTVKAPVAQPNGGQRFATCSRPKKRART
jgi:hypothetical protein